MDTLPAKIFKNKKIIVTSDGSFTFYSLEYSESYKTKSSGAFTESMHKFVNGSKIIDMLQRQDVRLLDICFGIGMNLAATINVYKQNELKNKLHIVSVEKDAHLINLVKETEILFPQVGYSELRKLLVHGKSDNISLELYISDAAELINRLSGSFDVIYFDPFSRKHNPEMWSEVMFDKLFSLLRKGGCLVTYASSRQIHVMLENAGFCLTEISSIGARHQPATYAHKLK